MWFSATTQNRGALCVFQRIVNSHEKMTTTAAMKAIYDSCCCDWANQPISTTSSVEEATALKDYLVILHAANGG